MDVTYYLIRKEVEEKFTGYPSRPLHDFCDRIKTKTPPREAYIEEGVPCLKLRNVTGKILNITNCDFIHRNMRAKLTTAKEFDILLTATGEGTAGRTDIFLEPDTYVVTGENILLRPRIDKVNPFYLLAALRSRIISKQLVHFVRGATGQTHLYWNDVANILIPEADDEIQLKCEQLYKEAWRTRRLSTVNIVKAKETVVKAGGVEQLDIKKRNLFFEANYKKLQIKMRFDPEYYQPIHEKLLDILEKNGCLELTKFAVLNKAIVNPSKSPATKFQYVDISSIDTEIGDYETTTLYGHEAPTRARKLPKNRDLIVSTVRPNRNAVAIIEKGSDNLVVSTGFAVITPKTIKPEILFAILKTDKIASQINRKATAAMYPAVTEEDIIDILVPKLSDNEVSQIEMNVQQSRNLLQKSNELLEEFRLQGELSMPSH